MRFIIYVVLTTFLLLGVAGADTPTATPSDTPTDTATVTDTPTSTPTVTWTPNSGCEFVEAASTTLHSVITFDSVDDWPPDETLWCTDINANFAGILLSTLAARAPFATLLPGNEHLAQPVYQFNAFNAPSGKTPSQAWWRATLRSAVSSPTLEEGQTFGATWNYSFCDPNDPNAPLAINEPNYDAMSSSGNCGTLCSSAIPNGGVETHFPLDNLSGLNPAGTYLSFGVGTGTPASLNLVEVPLSSSLLVEYCAAPTFTSSTAAVSWASGTAPTTLVNTTANVCPVAVSLERFGTGAISVLDGNSNTIFAATVADVNKDFTGGGPCFPGPLTLTGHGRASIGWRTRGSE